MSNKYGACRTWSNLINRWFDSKAECQRGEELALLERAGEIRQLEYQVCFVLSKSPQVRITVDFGYIENGKQVYEDVKGMGETREFRVKRIWLKQLCGIDIILNRNTNQVRREVKDGYSH